MKRVHHFLVGTIAFIIPNVLIYLHKLSLTSMTNNSIDCKFVSDIVNHILHKYYMRYYSRTIL